MMVTANQKFKLATAKFRLLGIRILSPSLYRSWKAIVEFPRPMISFIAEHCNHPLVGVEIGVSRGDNAYSILETLPIRKLYLIDPYVPYCQDGKTVTMYKNCFPLAMKQLSKFKNKIHFIINESSKAAVDVPDNLDFVYIDGNHTYNFVKQDIALYYPKIRDGGVFGGHDFKTSYLGVVRAVIEFVMETNLTLNGLNDDWWVVKKHVC